MVIIPWSVENWPASTIVGIVIAVSAALYSASSYLDKKYVFLKTLTRAYALGITGGMILGLGFGLFGLFFLVNQVLFLHTNLFNILPTAFDEGSRLVLPGLILGIVLGFAFGFVQNVTPKFMVRSDWRSLLFLLIFGGLLVAISVFILSWEKYFLNNSVNANVWSLGDVFVDLLAILGGLAIGSVTAQLRCSWRKFILWIICGGSIMSLVGLSVLFLFQKAGIFYGAYTEPIGAAVVSLFFNEKSLYFILYFETTVILQKVAVGFILGNILFKFIDDDEVKHKVTWLSFFASLAVAAIWVYLFRYLYVFIPLPFGETALLLVLMMGIVNGQGGKLIRQIKPRYKYLTKSQDLQPLVNWPRLLAGFIVGCMCGLVIGLFRFPFTVVPVKFAITGIGLFVYAPLTEPLPSFESLPAFTYFKAVVSNNTFTSLLAYGFTLTITLGIIIGTAYGFGPVVNFKIEHLSERRLGQIGLGLILLGILLTIFPH